MRLKMKHASYILVFIAGLFLLYMAAALIVFDFSEAAYSVGEETHNGKKVAFGPRPRFFFCKPSYTSISYNGSEWPFRIFRPVCHVWRSYKNYERPAEWRQD